MYARGNPVVNMKQIMLLVHLIGLSISAKLDNTYLPPPHAKSATGSHLLTTPFQGIAINTGRYQTPHGFSSLGQAYPTTNFPHSQNRLANVPHYPSVDDIQGHGSFDGPFGRSSYTHGPDNILRYNNQNNGDGSYEFDFETANKISQKEVGHLENVGTDRESSVVQGGYSYVAPNGQTIAVNYVADENGFRTSADGIPQSVHSQNLGRHYGSNGSGGHIPYSGYNRGHFGNQNAVSSRQNVIDHRREQNDFEDGTGITHHHVPAFHQTGSRFGTGGQNLKALAHYDGRNQRLPAPYPRHQVNRQYLPPSNGVHTGY